MPIIPPKLSILPYLQAWRPDTAELVVNVLLVPVGDPRLPLSDGWGGAPVTPAPSFQGATISLEAHLSSDAGTVPNRADVAGSGSVFGLAMPATQAAIFTAFANTYDLSEPPVAIEQSAGGTLLKYLPVSYRSRFAFVRPRTPLAFTDDRYHCALQCPPDAFPPSGGPSRRLSWGEAFAAMTRQPAVARAAGLVHTVTVPVGTAFDAGGWLFFELAAGSDAKPQHDATSEFVRILSTRVPPLDAARARPLFSPVQFPVAENAEGTGALGSLDDVFDEATRFDDGFAKIVHARQPLKPNLVAENDGEKDMLPLIEAGIQLGWDDEDVVEGMNRAVGLYPDGSAPPLAPSGIAGYRIDVRAAGTTPWSSLCRVRADSFSVGAAEIGGFEAELNVEIHPSGVAGQFWVPAYFSRWIGGSLVADTADERLLLNRSDDSPDLYAAVDPNAVPLRYGGRYEFRVRLADPTGGGPTPSAEPERPAEAPVVPWHFRRTLPLAPVTTEALPAAAGLPPSRFEVHHPGIGYPQALFANAPDALARLAAIARGNLASPADAVPAAIPDPDAAHLEIEILYRPPGFDPEADATGWQRLYRTYRSFPNLAPDGSAAPLALELDWLDGAQLEGMTWERPTRPAGTVSGPIAVPRARDVKLVLRAVGRDDLGHWFSDEARNGAPTTLTSAPLFVPAALEPPVLASNDQATAIASVFMQPDPPRAAPTRTAVLQRVPSRTLVTRLASAVGLVQQDGTLFGPPGERTVFICRGLKHHLAPDLGSLVLTAEAELSRQWINVIQLTVDRDWSWQGAATPFLNIKRTTRLLLDGESETVSLGSTLLPHAVNAQATRGEVDRTRTRIVIVDAFEPLLRNGLPYETSLKYDIEASFGSGGSESFDLDTRLPVTTPPRALPRVASVGHAFSPYVAAEGYASTEARERQLWIEFAEAPADERDVLFARVLASAPDPMLMAATEPVADPPDYEQPALDPEAIRVIRPGQSDDFAGLSAYQRLVPAAGDASRRFYLLPRPANLPPDADELLGFFTYELRIGHDKGTAVSPFWSTAQGRYGPPQTVEGVQHPAPVLDCRILKSSERIDAWAEYARPMHRGRDVSPPRPNSEIWFVLYARVVQADGASHRPLQLSTMKAASMKRRASAAPPTGEGGWAMNEVRQALDRWRLPEDTPLSALAVELLPEPNSRFTDPLGGDLGETRILRTSPLVEVSSGCCP